MSPIATQISEAILKLCHDAVSFTHDYEIDGIVCITSSSARNEHIVVKVHEKVAGKRNHLTNDPSVSEDVSTLLTRSVGTNSLKRPHEECDTSGLTRRREFVSQRSPDNFPEIGSDFASMDSETHDLTENVPKKVICIEPKEQCDTPPSEQEATTPTVANLPSIIPGMSRRGQNKPFSHDPNSNHSYECSICHLLCSSSGELLSHFTAVHTSCQCSGCGQSFTSAALLAIHMMQQHSRPTYADCTPSVNGASLDKLDKPPGQHHHRFLCVPCQEYFPNRVMFIKHRNVSHQGEYEILCQTCLVGFQQVEYPRHRADCVRASPKPEDTEASSSAQATLPSSLFTISQAGSSSYAVGTGIHDNLSSWGTRTLPTQPVLDPAPLRNDNLTANAGLARNDNLTVNAGLAWHDNLTTNAGLPRNDNLTANAGLAGNDNLTVNAGLARNDNHTVNAGIPRNDNLTVNAGLARNDNHTANAGLARNDNHTANAGLAQNDTHTANAGLARNDNPTAIAGLVLNNDNLTANAGLAQNDNHTAYAGLAENDNLTAKAYLDPPHSSVDFAMYMDNSPASASDSSPGHDGLDMTKDVKLENSSPIPCQPDPHPVFPGMLDLPIVVNAPHVSDPTDIVSPSPGNSSGYSFTPSKCLTLPIHPGPFRCLPCDKLCESLVKYAEHVLEVHQRYVCPTCAITLASKRNLSRHLRKHTGETPYSCDMCDASFERDDSRRKHKMVEHGMIYHCADCSTSGVSQPRTRPDILLHIEQRHGVVVSSDEDLVKHATIAADVPSHVAKRALAVPNPLFD